MMIGTINDGTFIANIKMKVRSTASRKSTCKKS